MKKRSQNQKKQNQKSQNFFSLVWDSRGLFPKFKFKERIDHMGKSKYYFIWISTSPLLYKYCRKYLYSNIE